MSQEVSRHRAKEMRRSRTKNDVSVIVLTKNSARTLEKCLVSIERERPFEIIAVDGQSKDGTLSILRKHRIKVLSETKEGWGVGFSRQLGVKAAGSPYVMFVDSDAELSPGCIAILRDNIEEFGWVGIQPILLSNEDATYWQWAAQKSDSGFNPPGPRRHIGTCGGLFRRETVLKHPFDPRMKYAAEDADLCLRLRKYGYIVGTTRAYAYHHYRRRLLRRRQTAILVWNRNRTASTKVQVGPNLRKARTRRRRWYPPHGACENTKTPSIQIDHNNHWILWNDLRAFKGFQGHN